VTGAPRTPPEPSAARDPLRLIGLAEAARLLGTDFEYLRDLAARGEFPAIAIGDSAQYKTCAAMVQAWAEAVGRRAAEHGDVKITAKRRRRRVA
jgi:hypothetical protein